MTERERSDRFWAFLHAGGGIWPDEFETLPQMSERADVIVRGRITDLVIGQMFDQPEDMEPPYPIAEATVTVDELLKGTVETRTGGTLHLRLFPPGDPDDFAWLQANIPDHEHLFFLLYGPLEMERLNQPLEEQEAERYVYGFINGQANLRNIGGYVRTVFPLDDRFPAGLEGEPFDAIMQRVRQAVDAAD